MAERIGLMLLPGAWSEVTAAGATLTAGSDPDGTLDEIVNVGSGQLLTRWRAATPAPDDAWIGVEFTTPRPVDMVQVIGTTRTRSAQWRIRAGAAAPQALETLRPIDDATSTPPPSLPAWSDLDDPVDDAASLAAAVTIGPGEETMVHLGAASGPLVAGAELQSVRIRAGATEHGGELTVDLHRGPPPPAPPAPVFQYDIDGYEVHPEPLPATLASTRLYSYRFDGVGFSGDDVALNLRNTGSADVQVYAVEVTADATAAAAYDSGWIDAAIPLSDSFPTRSEPALFATLTHAILIEPGLDATDPVVARHWRIDFRDDASPSGIAVGGLAMGQSYPIATGFGLGDAERVDTTKVAVASDGGRMWADTPGDQLWQLPITIALERGLIWSDIVELLAIAGPVQPIGVAVMPGYVGLCGYSLGELSARSFWGARPAEDVSVTVPAEGIPGQAAVEQVTVTLREFH